MSPGRLGMPLTAALGTLTLFLILAYLLPAITILAVLLILFPGLIASVGVESPLLATSAVLVVAFIHGFPCQLIEFKCLDRLWSRMYPDYHIDKKKRKKVMEDRSRLISEAEALSINHNHYDQTLGEYILFLNAGLWVGALALVRLIGSPWWGMGLEFAIAWVVLLAALISVLYVSPLYKKRYLDILEVIQATIDRKERDATLKSEK